MTASASASRICFPFVDGRPADDSSPRVYKLNHIMPVVDSARTNASPDASEDPICFFPYRRRLVFHIYDQLNWNTNRREAQSVSRRLLWFSDSGRWQFNSPLSRKRLLLFCYTRAINIQSMTKRTGSSRNQRNGTSAKKTEMHLCCLLQLTEYE